ncbi:MAG: hypothetical protein ABSB91_01415 [Sedimentisphaerales bacterium]
MSKTELRVISRIVLIGVGMYVLLQTLLTILSSIASLLFATSSAIKASMIIVFMAIHALLAIMAVYFLVRCANSISAKIVEPVPEEDTQVSWLAAAFRLVCVTTGILLLFWTIPSSIFTLHFYMNSGLDPWYQQAGPEFAKIIIMLVLIIYLLFGAPGFVRWQVKRTLKQCSKFEEQKPPCC